MHLALKRELFQLVLWPYVFGLLSFAKDMTMCSLLGFAARRRVCFFPPTSGMQPEKASRSHLGMLPEPALNWGTEPAAHSQASEFTWIRLTAEDLPPKEIYLGCQLSGKQLRGSHQFSR